MKYTENYRLRLPQGFEQYDIEDHNYNYGLLDETLKRVANGAGGDGTGGGGGPRAATLVIAPFDSGAAARACADLVLTGSNDGAAVNALLDGLLGGEVVFTEGTVVLGEQTPIRLTQTGLRVRGLGTVVRNGIHMYAFEMLGNACEVRDLTITGVGTSGGISIIGASCRVANVRLNGTFNSGYGVHSTGLDTVVEGVSLSAACHCAFSMQAPRFVLRGCKSFDATRAVIAKGARGCVVNCVFQSAAKDGVTFAVVDLQGGDTLVDGCVIGGPVDQIEHNPPIGLLLTNGWGQLIRGCRFHDVEYGINGGGDSWQYTQIVHNQFENATRGVWCVTTGDIFGCDISHNVFRPRHDPTTWYMLASLYLDASRMGQTSLCDNRAAHELKVYCRGGSGDLTYNARNVISGNVTATTCLFSGLYMSLVAQNAVQGTSSLNGASCKFVYNLGTYSTSGSGNTVI